MHKAVVGTQKQLTRYFRALEVADQSNQKVAKLEEWFVHAPGPRNVATEPMKKRISTNFR